MDATGRASHDANYQEQTQPPQEPKEFNLGN